jgi:hypothetical protein
MKKFSTIFIAVFFTTQIFSQTISNFENLALATDTFWDGSDLSGGFGSGNAYFVNDYNTSFMSWSGFAYSNKSDSTTPGYGNQYSAITGGGYNGSLNYVIGDEYGNAKIHLTGNAIGKPVKGFYVTNTTYAYLSMKSGDQFAKKFGGPWGADPDWFLLSVLGWENGILKPQKVDFYLADYRPADSTLDYAVRDWRWVDLQLLGDVDSILFSLSSSDTSSGFMNTPAYFAIDNFITSDQQNEPPVAEDDFVITAYVNDTLINVLDNDFDTTATPLKVELVGSPLVPGASDTVIDNQILYTPAIGIVATDTLIYRLCDAAQLCVTAKVVVKVNGITSLGELIYPGLHFSVYPNPFLDKVYVTAYGLQDHQPTKFIVFNVSGVEVLNEEIQAEGHVIYTENWRAGVYFLKVKSGEDVFVAKIVKQ